MFTHIILYETSSSFVRVSDLRSFLSTTPQEKQLNLLANLKNIEILQPIYPMGIMHTREIAVKMTACKTRCV